MHLNKFFVAAAVVCDWLCSRDFKFDLGKNAVL